MKNLFSTRALSRVSLFLCSIMAFGLTGCLDSDMDDAPEPKPVAYVSFYHGAPDAPDFNVSVDDEKINSQAFKYSNASNYLSLTTGNHEIAFTPVTATTALVDTTFNFKEDKVYSLFTAGSQQDIDILVVEDSLITPGTSKAGVRLINLSPDAPTVDVVMAGGGASPLFQGIEFKENSAFIPVTDGTHSFVVKETGTENVLVPATSLSLEPGRNYTLIVRGFQTPPTGNSNVLALQIVRNY